MPFESALVVLVPEAEALVERFRLQHDPSAAIGVPAHVTVLVPFKPPAELTEGVLQTLAELFARRPAFTATFAEIRRFPEVVYLAPEPVEAFRRLTEMLVEHFPETPPYGGQFAEIIPHLTVVQVADPQRLDEIAAQFERAAQGRLPIRADIREVALLDNASGRWEVRARLALGVGAPSS
jgi:2'-5' RNA ligase